MSEPPLPNQPSKLKKLGLLVWRVLCALFSPIAAIEAVWNWIKEEWNGMEVAVKKGWHLLIIVISLIAALAFYAGRQWDYFFKSGTAKTNSESKITAAIPTSSVIEKIITQDRPGESEPLFINQVLYAKFADMSFSIGALAETFAQGDICVSTSKHGSEQKQVHPGESFFTNDFNGKTFIATATPLNCLNKPQWIKITVSQK